MLHHKIRKLHQLPLEERHLPGEIKIVQTIHISQQSGKGVHQLKILGLKDKSVSDASAGIYIISWKMIRRGRVSL